jgi:hypothetical protein
MMDEIFFNSTVVIDDFGENVLRGLVVARTQANPKA